MGDAWVCTVAGTGKLVVRCEQDALTWHEVRYFATKRLRVDLFSGALSIARNAPGEPSANSTVVELRWVGDDYAHGGTPGGRKMQAREPGGEWVDA
jgi:hypothetical protein